jgi:hypothetical protein
MGRLALAMLAAMALPGCGASGTSTTPTRATAGSRTTPSQGSGGKPSVIDCSLYSDAVDGTLHYSIALPPGYDTSGERHPVIYVLHGLPANDQAYKGITGYADSLACTRGGAPRSAGAQRFLTAVSDAIALGQPSKLGGELVEALGRLL